MSGQWVGRHMELGRTGVRRLMRVMPAVLLTLGALSALGTVSAQAHGGHGGGHYGGHHGGHGGGYSAGGYYGGGYYGGGYGSPYYVAPLAVAPLYYSAPYRPAYPPGGQTFWWCAPYQRYYPEVNSCPIDWQPVVR